MRTRVALNGRALDAAALRLEVEPSTIRGSGADGRVVRREARRVVAGSTSVMEVDGSEKSLARGWLARGRYFELGQLAGNSCLRLFSG